MTLWCFGSITSAREVRDMDDSRCLDDATRHAQLPGWMKWMMMDWWWMRRVTDQWGYYGHFSFSLNLFIKPTSNYSSLWHSFISYYLLMLTPLFSRHWIILVKSLYVHLPAGTSILLAKISHSSVSHYVFHLMLIFLSYHHDLLPIHISFFAYSKCFHCIFFLFREFLRWSHYCCFSWRRSLS